MNDDELSAGIRVVADDAPAVSAIQATLRSKARRRGRTRPTMLATVAAAAVAGIVIGAITLGAGFVKDSPTGSSPNQDAVTNSSLRCYATASLNQDTPRNYLPITIGSKDGSGVPAGPQALELCAQHWSEGILSTTEPYIPDQPTKNSHVPHLVACVLPDVLADGNEPEVAVFPGSDTICEELNLDRYAG